MNPALIALILEAVLKYGIPAVTQLIQTFSKQEVTAADLDALLLLVEKPYGLVPDSVTVNAYANTLPDAPPKVVQQATVIGTNTTGIKSVKLLPDGGALVCYTDGSCYIIPANLVTKG